MSLVGAMRGCNVGLPAHDSLVNPFARLARAAGSLAGEGYRFSAAAASSARSFGAVLFGEEIVETRGLLTHASG